MRYNCRTRTIPPAGPSLPCLLQGHHYHASCRAIATMPPAGPSLPCLLQGHHYHASCRAIATMPPAGPSLPCLLQGHRYHTSCRAITTMPPEGPSLLCYHATMLPCLDEHQITITPAWSVCFKMTSRILKRRSRFPDTSKLLIESRSNGVRH